MNETVQQLLLDRLMNDLDAHLFRGKVKIDGVFVDQEIHMTQRKDNAVRKYLYLQGVENVFVEEAILVATNGDILSRKPISIQKEEEGLVIAFEFVLDVREVEV